MKKIRLTNGGSWVDRERRTVLAGPPGAERGASDKLADSLVANGEAELLDAPVPIEIVPEPGPKPKAERKRGRGRRKKSEFATTDTTDDLGD